MTEDYVSNRSNAPKVASILVLAKFDVWLWLARASSGGPKPLHDKVSLRGWSDLNFVSITEDIQRR